MLRGTSCTSCPTRTGKDRSVRLSRQLAQALALRLAPVRFGIASRAAGVVAGAPSRERIPASWPAELRWLARRRWQRLQQRSEANVAAQDAAGAPRAAVRPAE